MSDETHDPSSGGDDAGAVERRSDDRVQISTTVSLSSTATFFGQSENLSVSGIYVVIPASLPVGSLVDLLFSLSTANRAIETTGEIRWARELDGDHPRWGYGIEFLRLDDTDRDLIEEFVQQREPITPPESRSH